VHHLHRQARPQSARVGALGSAAAHEVKPHSDKQLGLAMDIVEHLLRDVYILPKQVEAEFD
jgi:hypothetical protein